MYLEMEADSVEILWAIHCSGHIVTLIRQQCEKLLNAP